MNEETLNIFCGCFEALAGQLPSAKLPGALDLAEEAIQEQRDKVVKDSHCARGKGSQTGRWQASESWDSKDGKTKQIFARFLMDVKGVCVCVCDCQEFHLDESFLRRHGPFSWR